MCPNPSSSTRAEYDEHHGRSYTDTVYAHQDEDARWHLPVGYYVDTQTYKFRITRSAMVRFIYLLCVWLWTSQTDHGIICQMIWLLCNTYKVKRPIASLFGTDISDGLQNDILRVRFDLKSKWSSLKSRTIWCITMNDIGSDMWAIISSKNLTKTKLKCYLCLLCIGAGEGYRYLQLNTAPRWRLRGNYTHIQQGMWNLKIPHRKQLLEQVPSHIEFGDSCGNTNHA